MANIKSALEIALEKTEGIKGDKSALRKASAREEGKKLASSFFANPEMDLKKELHKYPKEEQSYVREGFIQILLSNLVLPREDTDLSRVDTIVKALEVLLPDKGSLKVLKSQIQQFFKHCLEDRKRLTDALNKQLGPLIRQKEQELSQKLGRPVRIDPQSDPDFAKAYSQHMGSLEDRYNQALSELKDQLQELLNQE
ncbi:MAG: hypothetical protein Kow009_07410 [Spirochaetales bacterium]